VRFLYLTGWRAGEAMNLTWANVDLDAGVVRLEPGTTKNGEGREFPFAKHPALKTLLVAQREATKALEVEQERIISHVFHRRGEAICSYAKAWNAACDAARVGGRLVHDLRRTAVRNLERAGVSRSVAMKLTGHKTEAVYRRYAITSAADLSDGVAKVAILHSAPIGSPDVLPFSRRQYEDNSAGAAPKTDAQEVA
jgi:integrase